MPLNMMQASILEGAGFLPHEIREINRGVDPAGYPQDLRKVFNSKPFQQMIRNRFNYWKTATLSKDAGGWGMTKRQVVADIMDYYDRRRGEKRIPTVWDFLKEAYRPDDKKLTRAQFGRSVSIRARQGRRMRGKYGQRLKRQHYPESPL